ncbi:MAG TPA: hypothetical protein P5121_16565 [Caldilineaceae bacterium]|nr:hypothetical protein [Caldilineaceae bacterium]
MRRSYWSRQLLLIGGALLGLLTVTLFTIRTVRAEERTVCPDGAEFTTIQAAIDAAAAGDTITLCAATYMAPLRIDKDLIVRGAGQTDTIVGTQTVTSVVALAPDTTLTLADLTLAQGSGPTVSAATAGPYTDTLTISNTLNLTGGDQVTTIINGNVGENVAIVQANTKIYVVNVTISLPATIPPVIAALAEEDAAASTFDGACILPLSIFPDLVAELIASLCDSEALSMAASNRIDALSANGTTALAAAAYEAVFGIGNHLILDGADQVTTIINGDVTGNVVVVQANTTVDVTNMTLSLTDGGLATITELLATETGLTSPKSFVFLPVISN